MYSRGRYTRITYKRVRLSTQRDVRIAVYSNKDPPLEYKESFYSPARVVLT